MSAFVANCNGCASVEGAVLVCGVRSASVDDPACVEYVNPGYVH